MKTPLHLWIVGGVSLVWHVSVAYNYVMIQMKHQAYLAALSDAQREFLAAAPVWFDAAWAVGVWFAVLGSLLLFMRARLARPAFGLALLGVMAAVGYSLRVAVPVKVEITDVVTVVVLFLLWRYARAMTRRGVLR